MNLTAPLRSCDSATDLRPKFVIRKRIARRAGFDRGFLPWTALPDRSAKLVEIVHRTKPQSIAC